MRDVTRTAFKTLGTALCAGLLALTAIPSASEAGDRHGRHGHDRYSHSDREWDDHDRRHRHRHRHHHHHTRSPRVVEYHSQRVVERPVYVAPPMYQAPMYQPPMYQPPIIQDRGVNLNFTIPLR
jgi:hypothetical protein